MKGFGRHDRTVVLGSNVGEVRVGRVGVRRVLGVREKSEYIIKVCVGWELVIASTYFGKMKILH